VRRPDARSESTIEAAPDQIVGDAIGGGEIVAQEIEVIRHVAGVEVQIFGLEGQVAEGKVVSLRFNGDETRI
jgi:hypothetical protein